MRRILFQTDSAAGVGTPSGPSTEPKAESPPAPAAPSTPPTPTAPPGQPTAPAAETVINGPTTEETELLRVKLAEKDKRIAELDATVKDREKAICENQDKHENYRRSVEQPATVPVRVGMFRKG